MGVEDLPQFVAFKGDNGKYLGLYLDREYMKFGYDDLSSPYVMHELVVDPKDDRYVHIKCCYNNKFWRDREDDTHWMFAGADCLNTDRTSCRCTLFEPTFDVGSNKVSLRFLKLNKFVARWRLGEKEKLDSCLYAGEGQPDECGVMTYYDLESLVTLPKYVAFKGDNNMYLAASCIEGHPYLQFNTTDIGQKNVIHEVVPVGDGTVRLKSLYWNKFWRRSPNWIWADTVQYDLSNKDLLFEPIKLDDQKLALRCLGNNWFCKRLTTEGKTNCLNAGTDSLEGTAKFQVDEPIVKRRVHSIKYHMDTAYIYDLEPLDLFHVSATNTSDQATTLQVGYSYKDMKSTTWKCARSFTLGIKFTFDAKIPLVAGGKVEISGQFGTTHEWGATQQTETTVQGTYPAPVKAGQTVEVTVKGTRARCDVKYSYIQEDMLSTGQKLHFKRDDGVFNGVNYTDVQFETRYP